MSGTYYRDITPTAAQLRSDQEDAEARKANQSRVDKAMHRADRAPFNAIVGGCTRAGYTQPHPDRLHE